MVASLKNVGIVSHSWFKVDIYTLIVSNPLRYLIRQRSGCYPRRVRNHSNIREHMRNQGKYYGLKWAFFYELAHSHRPFWKTTDWTTLYNHWEKGCICQSQGTFSPPQRLKILAEFWLLGANARNQFVQNLDSGRTKRKRTSTRCSKQRRIGAPDELCLAIYPFVHYMSSSL